MSEPVGDRQILIVEDEPEFASLIQLWLDQHGWGSAIAKDGFEALELLADRRPDLVLLDLGVPGVDGWGLLPRIREVSQVPILIVTAFGSEADKVRGLGAGADDYITKPLSFPELIARIEAALRRTRRGAVAPGSNGVIRRGELCIELREHRVRIADIEVHLTPTEFRLLRHLAEHPDELLSHRELLQAVWGPSYGGETQLLRVTMRNLRAKLSSAAPGRRFIDTEYGLGYRLAEP